MAIDHCQRTFRWDRWSCPQSTFIRQTNLRPTKESAYSKAIIAAGIVHVITKNCSRGEIESCGCDPRLGGPLPKASEGKLRSLNYSTPKGFLTKDENVKWTWGGCSDDPTYGDKIATKFLIEWENGRDVTSYIDKHNSKIGREIVKSTMTRRCRCHGVSASCSLQTCWMQVAPFEEISRKLKERYRKSVRVTYESVEECLLLGNSARAGMVEKEISGAEHRLIYLEQSPDYCLANHSEGLAGTKGRICSRNPKFSSTSEKNSCRNLCRKCGHSVKRLQKQVATRCNCNFTWCCEVKCDTCTKSVDEHFCN